MDNGAEADRSGSHSSQRFYESPVRKSRHSAILYAIGLDRERTSCRKDLSSYQCCWRLRRLLRAASGAMSRVLRLRRLRARRRQRLPMSLRAQPSMLMLLRLQAPRPLVMRPLPLRLRWPLRTGAFRSSLPLEPADMQGCRTAQATKGVSGTRAKMARAAGPAIAIPTHRGLN